ncbi:MAG: hypothetical protein ACI8UO_002322 [Verrucomicrobiales bacterium]|jgi:uncharacterized protein (TIGR02598 family)
MRANRPTRRGGFSLVDVTLAIGIAAPALIAILGVMSVGHSSLKIAQLKESEAAILQTLAGQFQMRPWTEIRELEERGDSERFFFDSEGYLLGNDSSERIFTAQVTVLGAPQLPGVPSSQSKQQTFSRRLEILIDSRPLPQGDLFQDKRGYRTDTILIVNTSNDSSTQN